MNGIAHAGMQRLAVLGGAQESLIQNGDFWIVGLVYVALTLAGLITDLALIVFFLLRPWRWAASVRDLIDRAWPTPDAFRLGITLIALLSLVMSARLMTDTFALPPVLSDPRLWIMLQSVLFHWTGLFLIIGYTLRHPAPNGNYFGLERRRWSSSLAWGFVFYLASIPFLWFYTLIYQAGLQHLGYEPTLQKVAEILTDEQPVWLRVYFLFMGIVLAPCFEEVLFRGIALPLLARRWGAAPALFTVSAVFALIHAHLPSLVPLFIISTAFSLAYLYTKSILAPMVMHAVFNAVNLGLMAGLKGS